MNLKCRLVRIPLAWKCLGESPPGWVDAHLARCEECRAEASASARLISFLETHSAEGAYPRAWADLRADLGEPRATRRARSFGLVLGVAAVCLVIASIALWPVSQPVQKRVTAQSSPVRQERPVALQQPLQKRAPTAPAIKSSTKRVAPQPVRMKRSVPRLRRLTRPDPSLIAREQPPSPDAKEAVVAIAPEEHVISVVGVSIDQGNEDHYVIREVSAADDEASAVKL